MAGESLRLDAGDRLPLTWVQIKNRAKAQDWENLSAEMRLKLSEEETKSKRMGIPIDFLQLGFRILRIAAELRPSGSWETRLAQLENHAEKLLGDRHPVLNYVNQCSERMQALVAINTSPAWAELASIFRVELEQPEWALDAAEISLEKDSGNVAALTTKVSSHGDLGNFDAAEEAYQRAIMLEPKSSYLAAAISKVRLRERKFDEAIDHGMSAFKANPHPATARLVANIYKEAGFDRQAHRWYQEAEFIEGAEDEQITQAHILGLLELAKAAAANPQTSNERSPESSHSE